MRVCVTLEQRFYQTPDGTVWCQTGYTYEFWIRYLQVFEEVLVVARVQLTNSSTDCLKKASGRHVRFLPLPYYIGPLKYALQLLRLFRTLRSAVRPTDAVILRVPSQIATTLWLVLVWRRQPYGVEVVGDPEGVFARGATNHPLRYCFRLYFSGAMRWQCKHAIAAAYVTEHTLQRSYPASTLAFTTYYSSVMLTSETFVPRSRIWSSTPNPGRIVSIGSMQQMYKGFDVLINAVAQCIAEGVQATLTLVGEGRYRAALESQVRSLRVEKEIKFLGQITQGEQIRDVLDEADVFILASRTEGLPQAMIEAMARGLPAIGSSVGGIPELIGPDYLVPPGDVECLTQRIKDVLYNPEVMTQASKENLLRARSFEETTLQERRTRLYNAVKTATKLPQKRSQPY